MGKSKSPTLFAGTPTRPEPPDNWMKDLQLQTVAVDTARWTPQTQQALWYAFKPPASARRWH